MLIWLLINCLKISGVINQLKYVFPKQILINLYKSLFTPHLNYGSLVWGTITNKNEILQKRILRIITNSSYIAHTEPILKELGLINVKDMFSLKIFNFFHKLSHNMLPPYFESYKQFFRLLLHIFYVLTLCHCHQHLMFTQNHVSFIS